MALGWRERLFGAGRRSAAAGPAPGSDPAADPALDPSLAAWYASIGEALRTAPAARPPQAAGAPRAAGEAEAEPAHARGATLPRLADPDDRATAAVERAQHDLPGAIEQLEKYRRAYAPDPALLHAHCLLLHRAGRLPEAIEVARAAIPLCFQGGRGLLVAEIFEALEADAEAIGLGRDQLLALGGTLARTSHWSVGFRALATVLLRDPSDADAARDLLRLADRLLGNFAEPAEARRVAHFVVATAADPDVWVAAVARCEQADEALGEPAGAAAAPAEERHALSGVLD